MHMNTDVSARIGALELGILPPLPHDALLEATVSVPPLTQGHSPWGRCFGDGALESAAAVSLGPTQSFSAFCHRIEVSTPE